VVETTLLFVAAGWALVAGLILYVPRTGFLVALVIGVVAVGWRRMAKAWRRDEAWAWGVQFLLCVVSLGLSLFTLLVRGADPGVLVALAVDAVVLALVVHPDSRRRISAAPSLR
jgi:hypothetical protein